MSVETDITRALWMLVTPLGKGTAFHAADIPYAITSYRLVQGIPKVLFTRANGQERMGQVVAADPLLDLAMVALPGEPVEGLTLDFHPLQEGDTVQVAGYVKEDLHLESARVELPAQQLDELQYLVHDRLFHPDKLGGPLLDASGRVVGIHVDILEAEAEKGYALTIRELWEYWKAFEASGASGGERCEACLEILFADPEGSSLRCPSCGSAVVLPQQWEVVEPEGVHLAIEQTLSLLDYAPALARRGPGYWELKRGSASIQITYHEDSGLISADAFLCHLTEETSPDILSYLLRQNAEMEGLAFSLQDEQVVLSRLLFDHGYDERTGAQHLEKLLQKADDYDNILVEIFRASW